MIKNSPHSGLNGMSGIPKRMGVMMVCRLDIGGANGPDCLGPRKNESGESEVLYTLRNFV